MLSLQLHIGHWKRPCCWKRLKAGGEGDDRKMRWLMASPAQWTLVWASSGRRWRTGKPGMLQSLGSQRVRHDLATELNWKVEWVLFTLSKLESIKAIREAERQSYHKPLFWSGDPQPGKTWEPERLYKVLRVCLPHRAPQLLIPAPKADLPKHPLKTSGVHISRP